MDELIFISIILFGIAAIAFISAFLVHITDYDGFRESQKYLWMSLGSAAISISLIVYANTQFKTEYKIPTKEVKQISYTKNDEWGKLTVKSYYSWKHINGLLVDNNILMNYDTLSVVEIKEVGKSTIHSVILSSSIPKAKIDTTLRANQKMK